MQQHGLGMTAGQFAKKAGVTIRTVRFYDKVGLLPASHRADNGYRYYEMQDLARLQRILTLKYIGLSIDEIKKVIRRDGQEEDLRESLRVQDTIIRRKMEHLRLVRKAVAETLTELEARDEEKPADHGEYQNGQSEEKELAGNNGSWELFTSIIRVVTQEEQWVEQYQNASNLHTRIRLHDGFSVNPCSWHQWLFDCLELSSSSRILELGCGDGSLWQRNMDRIPEHWDITLTDFSEGMLQDAKDRLTEDGSPRSFRFMQADVRAIPFPDGSFDAVLANHMLYHVNNRHEALQEIYRVLKPGGRFYASTIGRNHLREMKELLRGFNPELGLSEKDFADEFGLENGEVQLEAAGFRHIELKRYEDSLRITEAEPLIAYICSTTGNNRSELSGSSLDKFRIRVESLLHRKGFIGITKDSGLFTGYK